jgi:hypoxanthine phosphoribosyltransferase
MSSYPECYVLFTSEQIESGVKRLAGEITEEYQGKSPILICILKGVFIFMADLVRHLDFPLEVEFIRLSSYSNSQQTSGKVKVVQGLSCPIKDRHVLIVEDIIDTGITITFLVDYLKKNNPTSLKICALLDKPSRRIKPIKINYLGFDVPDKFLVGYGLDYNEQYRNLPDICYLEE